MKWTSLQYPRLTIAILTIAIALGIWIPFQVRLARAHRLLDDLRKQVVATDNRTAAARKALEMSRRELKTENARRERIAMDLATAEKALGKVDPETRWTTPPPTLPEWNPDSPYVWLRKEMVPRFPVEAFNEEGELSPEIAYVLMVDPKTLQTLNTKLKGYLAEYRALEVAKAERSDEHLPGVANEKGEKLTIRVQPLPEEGGRIKQQFENDLVNALGEQRATMVKQVSETWIDSQFAQFGAEPKTISIVRRSNGYFGLSTKSGSSWFSTAGTAAMILRQIPPHFRPLFTTFLEPATAKAQ
jgi:hypothetical protein